MIQDMQVVICAIHTWIRRGNSTRIHITWRVARIGVVIHHSDGSRDYINVPLWYFYHTCAFYNVLFAVNLWNEKKNKGYDYNKNLDIWKTFL